MEGLEPQILSPQHLPYAAHNPLHLLFTKRPDPPPETHFVYGDDLRNVDDTWLWQVGVAFVEFYVTWVISTVRGRGRKANYHSI